MGQAVFNTALLDLGRQEVHAGTNKILLDITVISTAANRLVLLAAHAHGRCLGYFAR